MVGLFASKYAIENGGFNTKAILVFNLGQVVANAAAWILCAPVLDILIYKEPANKVFAQGAAAFVANVIVVAVVGTLLAWGYSKVKTQSSSLKAEN